MNRLAGKVALITGGGSGIGAATARLMCSEAAKVMLVDANPEGLANTQKAIAERVPGASIGIFQADVSDATKAQNGFYSITSSAVASSDSGTVSPSALAVLRLMTSANFVGSWIGRSAGLSPLRMRST
jgi:2-hydroxycyclohexanecarboxyl-CoA dehydrogenase